MDVIFTKMTEEHGKDVMDIFNYYAEKSFSAYPETKLPYGFYTRFLEMTKDYPAYIIKDEITGSTIGFCFLRAYNPFPAFRETAEITYFIDKDFVGKGIGMMALSRLIEDAKRQGIKTILASVTSENTRSLEFHTKNGFFECGRMHKIGRKFGKCFDIVWMQKDI